MPELNKPDTPARRPWGRYAAVAAAVVLLALTPLAWFWFSDTALLGAPAAMTRPYTSLTATGDDFYLIRQLRAQREAIRTSYGFDFGRDGIENLYTGSAESMEDMTYSWGMAEYLTEMIEQLREAQVLDDTWADAAQRAVGYGKGADTVYYSNDSLGFTRISVFRTDLYVPLLSVVVESKTSLPVTVWITSEDPLPEPDIFSRLYAWIEYNDLDGLGDWVAPAATDWAASALYSARGGVMMSGGTGAMLENLGGGTFLCMHLGAREF